MPSSIASVQNPPNLTQVTTDEGSDIPQDWQRFRLGSVAEFETGKREKGGATTTGDVFSIGGEHITEHGNIDLTTSPKYIPRELYDSLRQGKIRVGDSLIVKDGARTGKSVFIRDVPEIGLAVNEHVFIVRPQPQSQDTLDSEFLGFWLRSANCLIQVDRAYHGLIGGINREDIATFALLLPPLPQQRTIASVLWRVQQAKEAGEHVITATRQLKKSLLRHFFTYGPVPFDQTDQVPLKETETGRISESWSPMKIGDIAQVRGGTGFPPEHQGSIEGEYPFLKVSDMNLVGNEVFMKKANNYISEAVRNQLRARPFKAGTIIFPKVGAALHTNKKRILVRDSLIDNNVMGVTVSSENRCLPEFLYRWFETINLSNLSNPGPLPSINGTRVKATPIFLPTLVDQKEIATQLSAVDAKLAAEEARRDALANLFQSLLHHLMTGKMRVTT